MGVPPMKLDKIDTSKRFSKRLLGDFTNGLFDLLKEKELETITIAELCDKVNYPRSTFYNYFEDIYALMDYCWDSISSHIKITNFQEIEHDKRTLALFDMVYDYMYEKRMSIDKLLKHNHPDGAMILSLDRYIKKTIYQMISVCPFSYKYPVPYDIIAQHYSNTIQMVLSACFIEQSISRKEASAYIDFLLGTLEKESTRK